MDGNQDRASVEVRRRGWADLSVAGVAAALGLVLIVGAREINLGVGYDRIGPRFFPYSVGAGLMLVGGILAARVVLGHPARKDTEHSEPPINWRPLSLVLIALLLDLLLLEPAGFVIASAGQFWVVARAFHSERPVRDAVVGLSLAVTVYYAFSRGLGLSLPAGVLEILSSRSP